MAQKATTQILCSSDALSRAATELLAKRDRLTKNAILNTLAAAIAGPGHDWGFIKNAPDGQFIQNGLELPRATPDLAGETVWTVFYDEREDWARSPIVFPTREAALAHVAEDHAWWKSKEHPFDVVMKNLEEEGHHLFAPDADFDDEAYDNAQPFSITIEESTIQPDAIYTPGPAYAEPEAAEDILVLFEREGPMSILGHQGTDGVVMFEDQASLERHCAAHFIELDADPDLRVYTAQNCRLTAHFEPQAWVRNYAMAVDAEGDTEWIVEVDELRIENSDLDYLQVSRHAPKWVRDWTGPFTICLEIEPLPGAVDGL